MSETWNPVPTTPRARAEGMRRLTRLTAGLSIGAVAATGVVAAAVGVGQLESSGVQVLPGVLTGDDGATGGGGALTTVPGRQSGTSGLIRIAPQGVPHATTGGS
ncbi:hypothetical protein Q6346_08390 [Isoptericola sp. b490]|uniref:hypothetical protein n=1 Tax=Actinotalea lenta TaxID=3064654 RepID=UPI002713F9DA|nr:hypothetical protein [Isoptericola sp. b490]MDO8121330.1 hypothetical protein [Isoptericola sp. b490]